MWHELVLHGIGGRTIAEAKRTLSWVEAQQHLAYIRRRGSLNLGTRIEAGFALLAWLIANKPVAYGMRDGKPLGITKKADGTLYTIRDFMPHADPEKDPDRDEDGNLTIDAITRALTGGKK